MRFERLVIVCFNGFWQFDIVFFSNSNFCHAYWHYGCCCCFWCLNKLNRHSECCSFLPSNTHTYLMLAGKKCCWLESMVYRGFVARCCVCSFLKNSETGTQYIDILLIICIIDFLGFWRSQKHSLWKRFPCIRRHFPFRLCHRFC